MIVVTGAAGFIGSCCVSQLNKNGRQDLILVDNIEDDLKKRNLDGKQFKVMYDKNEFLSKVESGELTDPVSCIIHMGACSSTTLQDAQYFEQNNFLYTKVLAEWALDKKVRFIYASSAATYGDGAIGYADDVQSIKKCQPLNLYGQSKQKFDLWVLENQLLDKVVGLKFFNVFGPNEYHKKDMRSVVAKSYHDVVDKGVIRLFKSTHPDYADGGQKRDFIYVKDVLDVIMFFMDNPDINGIFNVGTGQARTWNDLAKALFMAVNKDVNIEYVDMPETLIPRYQNFTQADMRHLRSVGYSKNFTPLENAVADYVTYLKNNTVF